MIVDYNKHNEEQKPIPFKTMLGKPLKVGQTIHALGRVMENAKRFDFNLHTGCMEMETTDIPLHLSFRFDEGKVVFNTYEAGTWKKEIRHSNPFKMSEEFDLRVRCLDGKFQVYGNRHELYTFEMRLPIGQVSHMSITGDLAELKMVHFGGQTFEIPLKTTIYLAPGKRLDITGVAEGKRFDVNLYTGNAKDICLQLSVRPGENTVVRNSMNNQVWRDEEREGKFPFKKRQIFDLTIGNESYSYQIFVNGERFTTFAHRCDPNDIRFLEVTGSGVDLMYVNIS